MDWLTDLIDTNPYEEMIFGMTDEEIEEWLNPSEEAA